MRKVPVSLECSAVIKVGYIAELVAVGWSIGPRIKHAKRKVISNLTTESTRGNWVERVYPRLIRQAGRCEHP